MYKKTILCLANSRKPTSGRCVAGKEFDGRKPGAWIRPVSSRPEREVSEEERRYENGKRAQLLDIVAIPLIRLEPLGHQRENHVLADDYYWERLGGGNWRDVKACVDPYDANFWIRGESTYHGSNDKISEGDAAQIKSSLKLILLPRLQVSVRSEAGYEGRPGRRRVRGSFDYQGGYYMLSITDPEIEEEYLQMDNGQYTINDVAVCVSLSEPYHGYAFRLIAAVISEVRCEC